VLQVGELDVQRGDLPAVQVAIGHRLDRRRVPRARLEHACLTERDEQ
jgi:hypothetical protein